MDYTVAIRTLGKAGDKYQKTLNSLLSQTLPPKAIHIYIAEGYELPKETVGVEKYFYVPKGMVAQRALQYKEIETEYILFLDDDVYLPNDFVEKLFNALVNNQGDVISPDIYNNSNRWSVKQKWFMAITGRVLERRNDDQWAFKVMRTTGFSFNGNPQSNIYQSQTNAGACFLCKKESFLKICLQEELWLDQMPYAMGEDQVTYYKMHLCGLKVLTIFNSGIVHLDAGEYQNSSNKEKELKRVFCDFRFKTIFWFKFIFKPEKSILLKLWDIICFNYVILFSFITSIIKLDFSAFKIKMKAIHNGVCYIRNSKGINLSSIS